MHEWPLLIFTLLTQASIGVVLFAALTSYWLRDAASHVRFQVVLPAVLCAGVCGVLGLMASFAHLGYPLNAINALRNVGRSWLTREIIFASLYLAILGIVMLQMLWVKRVHTSLLLLTGCAGLVLVFCMGKIYLSTSVVTWMHPNNFALFFGSVAILGASLAMVLIAPRLNCVTGARRLLNVAVGVIVVAVAVRLLVQPLYLSFLAAQQTDAITFPLQPLLAFDALATMRLITWCLMVAGAGLFTLTLRYSDVVRGSLLSGAGLLVVAEIMARYTFYSIH